jgi:uncharacterized protein (TIGR00255 family)
MAFQSMTAYCSSDFEISKTRYRISLKSVNNKTSEVKVRAPKNWASVEIYLRNFLIKELHRGTIDFYVDEISESSPQVAPAKNARSYLEKLNAALEQTHDQGFWIFRWFALVINSHLIQNERDYTPKKDLTQEEITPALKELCQKLSIERSREGKQLFLAFENYLSNINSLFSALRTNVGTFENQWKSQIKERISKLMSDNNLPTFNEDRIHQEILYLAEKRTVEEEMVRIETHLSELRNLLSGANFQPIGKRIEFLLQELHREWTTFGNKIQNAGISNKIIDAKLELEKMREQSLNVL